MFFQSDKSITFHSVFLFLSILLRNTLYTYIQDIHSASVIYDNGQKKKKDRNRKLVEKSIANS